MLERTRDALLHYAISPNFPCEESNMPQTVESLSNELLIDLKVSKNVFTNEILQAIESLQTYVIRMQTNQEDINDLRESHFLKFINSLTNADDFIRSYGISSDLADGFLIIRQNLGEPFTDIDQLRQIGDLDQFKEFREFRSIKKKKTR